MRLPLEIIEKIILKCDGRTLKQARRVNEEWKCAVDYLSKRTPLWKWCCLEEISDKELIDYLEQYKENDGEKWRKIYDNWLSWHDLSHDVICDMVVCPAEVSRISCVAVSTSQERGYIAVGSEDGKIRIFTENWKLMFAAREKASKVVSVSFLQNEHELKELCYVVAYPRALVIYYVGTKQDNRQFLLEDIRDHSVYKNYICYEKVRGRISIVKVCSEGGGCEMKEVWFSRIYSPIYPTCLNIWNGTCSLLINNEIQIVKYLSAETPPISGLERLTRIKSTLSDQNSEKTYQILRDDIVISLARGDIFGKQEFIEFFFLGPKDKYSKKLFNTWEVLQSFITCIFVYGHTLIIGVDIGIVYFYHVSSWKYFDIRNYKKKIIIGRHPIISIAVKEIEKERRFYVASNFSIHEVVGYTVNTA